MNTVTTLDDNTLVNRVNPGAQLSAVREQKGYTLEYVANKLHLRARVIELLENNEFNLLPGPVFVKGYIRAYAKLLDISPEPYLALFNEEYVEKKPERALWQQSKRESNKGEHIIRWLTILFAVGVVVAIGIWWQKNLDTQQQAFLEKPISNDLSLEQSTDSITQELKLTDISKMQSLLNPKPQMSPLEKVGE